MTKHKDDLVFRFGNQIMSFSRTSLSQSTEMTLTLLPSTRYLVFIPMGHPLRPFIVNPWIRILVSLLGSKFEAFRSWASRAGKIRLALFGFCGVYRKKLSGGAGSMKRFLSWIEKYIARGQYYTSTY